MQQQQSKTNTDSSLEAISLWLSEKLRVGNVPRISDIVDLVKREGLKVSRKNFVELLQKDPVYAFNMHQQKKDWDLENTDQYCPRL